MKGTAKAFSYIVVAAISVFAYRWFSHSSSDKIGYVRTGLLLEKYEGMKIANDQFTEEMSVTQTNLDTLKQRLEKLKFAQQAGGGKELDQKIQSAETEYVNYSRVASEQMESRRGLLTKDVIDRVNDFIKDYGKKNGYKLILGTTSEGNILYGEEEDDLTNEILTAINKSE